MEWHAANIASEGVPGPCAGTADVLMRALFEVNVEGIWEQFEELELYEVLIEHGSAGDARVLAVYIVLSCKGFMERLFKAHGHRPPLPAPRTWRAIREYNESHSLAARVCHAVEVVESANLDAWVDDMRFLMNY